MKTKKQIGKKALSVFLAIMMLMSAWVFVAPEAEASGTKNATQLKEANLALLNTLTKPGEVTLPTTVGRFNYQGNGDVDSNVNKYGTQSYINVVYSPKVTNGNDPAVDFGMGQSQRADSVKLFYPETVLMVDGKSTPQMGVLLAADAYSGQNLRCISCWMPSGSGGLVFKSKESGNPWIGKAKDDSCFYYIMYQANETKFRISSDGVNGSNKCGTNSGEWTFFANHLQFTGTLDANEWLRTITPSWRFMGGSNDSDYFTKTATKNIYVVNVKAYNDLITEIFNGVADVKANAAKYKTESVQAYVNAIKGIINASPANYSINTNGGTGAKNWENAIKSAKTAYDNAVNNAKLILHRQLFSRT